MTKTCFPFFFNRKNKSKSLAYQEIVSCIQAICSHYRAEPFQSISNLLVGGYKLAEKELFMLIAVMAKAREPFEEDSGASLFNYLPETKKKTFLEWYSSQKSKKSALKNLEEVIHNLQRNSVGIVYSWQHVDSQDLIKILRGAPVQHKKSAYITEKSGLLQFCCIQPSPSSAASSRATSPANSRTASPLTVESEDLDCSDRYSLNRNP